MIVTICYFLKSIKSVFKLVQCNTSLSKLLCCTFNNRSLCDKLNLRKKVCLGSLDVSAYRMKSVTEQGLFHELTFDNKALETLSNFESAKNVRSSNAVEFEFEVRHIPTQDTSKTVM